MRVVLYRRVSTDDKGQDPDRQKAPLARVVERDRHVVVGDVVDEGTSAGEKGLPTFDRPKVRELLAVAKREKAHAILVENVDRWTRKGPSELGYSMFVLQRDHGLQLLFADLPEDPFAREVLPPLMATLARMDNQRKSDMARTSVAQRKARGERIGRKPKPDLSDDEFAAVIRVMAGASTIGGLRLAALEVSRRRGAHEVADPKARRDRMVSKNWVANQLFYKRPETLQLLGRVVRPGNRPPSRKAALPDNPQDPVAGQAT